MIRVKNVDIVDGFYWSTYARNNKNTWPNWFIQRWNTNKHYDSISLADNKEDLVVTNDKESIYIEVGTFVVLNLQTQLISSVSFDEFRQSYSERDNSIPECVIDCDHRLENESFLQNFLHNWLPAGSKDESSFRKDLYWLIEERSPSRKRVPLHRFHLDSDTNYTIKGQFDVRDSDKQWIKVDTLVGRIHKIGVLDDNYVIFVPNNTLIEYFEITLDQIISPLGS